MKTIQKEAILKDTECTGIRCEHETGETHYIFTEADLDTYAESVRRETYQDLLDHYTVTIEAVNHKFNRLIPSGIIEQKLQSQKKGQEEEHE